MGEGRGGGEGWLWAGQAYRPVTAAALPNACRGARPVATHPASHSPSHLHREGGTDVLYRQVLPDTLQLVTSATGTMILAPLRPAPGRGGAGGVWTGAKGERSKAGKRHARVPCGVCARGGTAGRMLASQHPRPPSPSRRARYIFYSFSHRLTRSSACCSTSGGRTSAALQGGQAGRARLAGRAGLERSAGRRPPCMPSHAAAAPPYGKHAALPACSPTSRQSTSDAHAHTHILLRMHLGRLVRRR